MKLYDVQVLSVNWQGEEITTKFSNVVANHAEQAVDECFKHIAGFKPGCVMHKMYSCHEVRQSNAATQKVAIPCQEQPHN